jgi:cysteine-rich repeat protein
MQTRSACHEICGDGIVVIPTVGRCDDGNIWSGDGCSDLCYVETGWSCSLGDLTTRSTCQEICGDGIDLHSYAGECDDGNLVGGDGCNSTCYIETGYNCTGGNLGHPDTC